MTGELIEDFADWLDERGAPDVTSFLGHLQTFLDWRAGAPLMTLDEDAIRAFLLDWCPRHLSLPADESWQVCDSLGEFVFFLGCTGRLRGGTEPARRLIRTTVALADTMRAKMADPSNYGMAKSRFAPIGGAEAMTEQELLAAMQQRIDAHNALSFDERKALTDHVFEQPPRTIELPLVHIPPPEADVAAVAAGAALPAKVQALRDYLGETGKALTAKGNLKLADGRALVDLLDTGDEFDPKIGETTYKTQSTATLRRLMYLIAVAEESGAVHCANDRLVPVKAWARKSPISKATKLFKTVIEFGVLSMTGSRVSFYTELHRLLYDGVVQWLARLMAPGARAQFDDIVELNERVVIDQFDTDDAGYYISLGHLAEDLGRILEMLDMTGAIEWTDREESLPRWGRRVWCGGTITVTAFGLHVLPDYLPAAGIVLRTANNLAEMDLADLIAVMDSVPHEQHSATLAAWKPSLTAPERAGLVAAMITDSDDARRRLIGLRLLGMFDADVAEPHMRQLVDTAAAGHAAIWLLDHGLADGETVGGFITPAIMVDILAQLVDHPDVLCEQFLGGHDPDRMLEFFWRHAAPETAAVLDVLGRHLPDRALAKRARKAAIKHRSWMANEGLG
jgi:hypothetical protein